MVQAPNLAQLEIHVLLLIPPKRNYSYPLVSMEDRFQALPQILKFMDAEVLYVKWHRMLHTFGPLYP